MTDPQLGPGRLAVGRRRFLALMAGGVAILGGACSGSGGSGSGTTATTHPAGSGGTRRGLVRTGELALADGFDYAVLSSTADGMPPAPDGMAAFGRAGGTIALARNHELGVTPTPGQALDPATAYDPSAPGGVTVLAVHADGRSPAGQAVALSGTVRNCAGGATPWGTWLSCEETTEGAAQGWEREHGYVFEVSPTGSSVTAVEPLRAMGRFLHEAVAVDPATGIVYMTEDNGYDSGLYRFVPTAPGNLSAGGQLEILGVTTTPGYDTAFGQQVGISLPVAWLPIGDPDPASASTDTSAVFNQGFAAGAARFKRAEGCSLAGGTWYVSVTEGGDAGLGQIWAYDLAAAQLRLVYEATDPAELFGPDNVVATPFSDGVLVAEDNGNGDANRLHWLRADGQLVTIAENVSDTTEFAGPCFSPDGSTLFVNVFGDETAAVPGRTLAIWGPWESVRA